MSWICRLRQNREVMKNLKKNIFLIILFILQGCWVSSSLAGTASFSDLEYNKGMEAALIAVIHYNPAISGKNAEVRAREFESDSARAKRYPTLSVSAGRAAQTEGTSSSRNIYTLRVRQPVWAFGAIDRGIAFADANILADTADLLRVKRDLIFRTALAYANIQGVYKRITVLDKSIVDLEKLYEQVQRRLTGQNASRADVSLAKSRLIQAKAQKERFKGDLRQALTDLQSLTKVKIDAQEAIKQHWLEIPEGVLDVILADSADILYKKRLFDVAEANADREFTSSMPTINLQADKYFNQWGLDNGIQYSIMMDASLDGFGVASIGNFKAARSRANAASEDLKVARDDLQRQVLSLLNSRETQKGLSDVLQTSIHELNSIAASYQRQYEAGSKSWLDILNIQRELTEQMLQQVQAQNDWVNNTIQLQAMMGSFDQLVDLE